MITISLDRILKKNKSTLYESKKFSSQNLHVMPTYTSWR